ncbi:unnamed protein product [Linum trigynum]|uniref:Uncharacterized protein n=1 Tax=Linum trigynum TaxID=586398 RepID=A0AAV2CDA2_9ROSI
MDFEGDRQVTVTKDAMSRNDVMAVANEVNDWRSPLTAYLQNETVPDDAIQARTLRKKATHYTLVEGQLCQRSFSCAYLKCLGPDEAKWTVKEIHQGSCASHSGPRSLERTILLQGNY